MVVCFDKDNGQYGDGVDTILVKCVFFICELVMLVWYCFVAILYWLNGTIFFHTLYLSTEGFPVMHGC